MGENLYQWLNEVLNAEYEFIRNLKRTEYSTINVLVNKNNNKRVVVKYLTGKMDTYKALLDFRHPNIPIIYDIVSDEDKSIIVEEYIDGITIDEILETGLYTSSGVKKVIRELCEILYFLHSKNIIHRDIKPENIIVDNDGNIKLIDFNISRINNDNQNKVTTIMGTNGYASPEQYGIARTDARSDI